MATTTVTVPDIGTEDEINAANKYLTEQESLMEDPYGVQAANSGAPSVPKVELDEPATSPSVISTDTMREQLEQAQKDLDAYKKETQGVVVKTDNEITNEKVDAGELPESEREDQPQLSEYDIYLKNANDEIKQTQQQFDQYLTRSDSLLRSQIKSINKAFDVRRNQAQDIANNAKAATQVLGARTGRMRYAPEIQRGIITGQESALISTLSEIDALEASTIMEAENAAYERDYGTFLDKLDRLDDLKKERNERLEELTALMEEENAEREREAERIKYESSIIEEIAGGVTDPIEIFQSLNGQVPYDLIVEYTSSVPQKDYEFITGTKHQASGYFDSTTGEFVSIGRTPTPEGYSLSINGSNVGVIGPNSTIDDIDALNISETAKSYVRMWKEGRMTTEEILQRLAGDKTDRALRNEVVGVISRMSQPESAEDDPMRDYVVEQANTAITQIEDLFDIMGVTIKGDSWTREGGFGTEATALSRWIGQVLPGTDARDIRAKLDTVEALIGFDALADMRAASPTGGALGQITERELKFLQSVQGSLDVAQSTEQFIKNLARIEKSFKKIRAINSAEMTVDQYKKEFPNASSEEIEEYKARFNAKSVVNLPSQSNSSLLLGEDDNNNGGIPSALDDL